MKIEGTSILFINIFLLLHSRSSHSLRCYTGVGGFGNETECDDNAQSCVTFQTIPDLTYGCSNESRADCGPVDVFGVATVQACYCQTHLCNFDNEHALSADGLMCYVGIAPSVVQSFCPFVRSCAVIASEPNRQHFCGSFEAVNECSETILDNLKWPLCFCDSHLCNGTHNNFRFGLKQTIILVIVAKFSIYW